ARLGERLEAWLLVERLRLPARQQLRADGHVVVAEGGHGRLGLARQHRVDAADLVAHLPADFEQLERPLRHHSVSLPVSRASTAAGAGLRRTCVSRSSSAVMNATNAAYGDLYGLK